MARTLDITIRADPAGPIIARRFTRFVSDLVDLQPLLEEVVDKIQEQLRRGFDTEGASTGSLWAPLSQGYRRWKLARYPGRGILVRTGRLRSSFTGNAGVRVVSGSRAEVGTDVPYAVFHQRGTTRMPARPIIRLSPNDRAEITRLVHRYLVKTSTGRLHG